MPILSFSISSHIPLLLDGRKVQTTRQPRKNPLKAGDTLFCYYKPRQKKMCSNCISDVCKIPFERRSVKDLNNYPACDHWTNYFGEAVVKYIIKVRQNENIPEYEMADYMPLFSKWSDEAKETWAKADGFPDFKSADEWFSKDNPNWKELEWDIIHFDPKWLKGV